MKQLNLFSDLPRKRRIEKVKRGSVIVLRGSGLTYKTEGGETVLPSVPVATFKVKGGRHVVR